MAMYIYICIYTENDTPHKKEGSQIACRDGRFETKAPPTNKMKDRLKNVLGRKEVANSGGVQKQKLGRR